MKKTYFLAFLLMLSSFTYSQELLKNGGLENWETNTKPTDWTKAESLTKASDEKHGGSFSAFRNGGKGTKDLAQLISGITPGASYTISFWYKVAGGDGTDARIWSAWKQGRTYLNDNRAELKGPNDKYLDNNGGAWTKYTVTLTAPANANSFNFEVRSYSGSKVYWDDLSFIKSDKKVPALSISEPTEGADIPSSTVTVKLSTQNFNVAKTGGDGYIQYVVDKATAVKKYDIKDITLEGLTEGNHSVEVELVDNSGKSLNPAVKKIVNFKTSSYTKVANIAELKAAKKGGFYQLTGEAIVSYARKYRNQKFIQDKTGGILIDDPNNIVKTAYNQFDGIKNIKGKLREYNKLLQFQPTEDVKGPSSTKNKITPELITLAEFVANFTKYESKLIKIKNVTFDEVKNADSEGGFEPFKPGDNFKRSFNYPISSNGAKSVFRTIFPEADYIGKPSPTKPVDLVVLGSRYRVHHQVVAINLKGIVTLGVEKIEIEGFGVYPNPAKNSITINTKAGAVKKVSVYNILGNQVIKKTIKEKELDVSNLNSGVYFLRVEENGKIATQKLIVE